MTEHPDISDTAVLSPGDRIRFVQKHAGMPSINALARSLDLKRSENLYQILKGNNGISKDLACRITKCFPRFSIIWLTTGQGEPLIHVPLPSGFKELPLHTALNFENDGSLSEPDQVLLFPDTLSVGGNDNNLSWRCDDSPPHARRLDVSGPCSGRLPRLRTGVYSDCWAYPALQNRPKGRNDSLRTTRIAKA